ncbi:flagellar biosynthesis protein FlgN [Roseobacteraceae bacterium NS-SX3]
MTEQTPQQLIDELDSILNRERAALMEGQLDKLGELLERKEAVIGALNSATDLERGALAHVQDKVARNQQLLDSAMDGIRAVAARMADLRRVRRGLDIYDKAGRKTSYGTRGSLSLEKRA